jgi:16S rRNA processing protein RimM
VTTSDPNHPKPKRLRSPVFVHIGTITRPHGILGEVKLQLKPEYDGVITTLKQVTVNGGPPVQVNGCRPHQGALLLRLASVPDRNMAETLRGAKIAVERKTLPKRTSGAFLADDLLGLTVIDMAGQKLGELIEILYTGSNDVYVVQTDDDQLLLPAIESCIKAINLDEGTMTVFVPDGL